MGKHLDSIICRQDQLVVAMAKAEIAAVVNTMCCVLNNLDPYLRQDNPAILPRHYAMSLELHSVRL